MAKALEAISIALIRERSIYQELIFTAQENEQVQVYILLSIQHTQTPELARNESLHQQEVLPYTYRY